VGWWPWRQAAGHLALLGLFALVAAELCLARFRKIPFTCSYLPGKTPVHLVILSAAGLMNLTLVSARHEKEALPEPWSIAALLVFALALAGARWWSAWARSEDDELELDEAPSPVVMELGLHRDGVIPIGEPGQGS